MVQIKHKGVYEVENSYPRSLSGTIKIFVYVYMYVYIYNSQMKINVKHNQSQNK